MNIIKVA